MHMWLPLHAFAGQSHNPSILCVCGDTEHTKELPASSQGATFTLFSNLLKVIKARGTDAYDDELAKLPSQCQNNYHELLQMAAMFRRGQEGLVNMRRDTYVKKTQSSTATPMRRHVVSYQKIMMMMMKMYKIQASLSSMMTPSVSTQVRSLRCIWIHACMDRTKIVIGSSKDQVQFQESSTYTPSLTTKPWLTNCAIGKNSIGKLLLKLGQIVGVPVQTNHSIRATGISAMKRAGFEDREVALLRGHKSLANLNSYHAPTTADKIKMAFSVQHGLKTLSGQALNSDDIASSWESNKKNCPEPALSSFQPLVLCLIAAVQQPQSPKR